MGLLDEAIRDHLELKRRRGADPSELARVEQEALEPVFPPEPGEEPSLGEDGSVADIDYAAEAPTELAAAPGEAPAVPLEEGAPGPAPTAESELAAPAHLGEDTAEIDMQAVLAEDAASTPMLAGGSIDERMLEWETPTREPAAAVDAAATDSPDGAPMVDPPIPGQESLSFE